MSKAINLPKAVKVGPHYFSIIARGEKWKVSNDCEGKTDTVSLEIDIITENRKASFILDTLIHELFHAIWWVIDLKDEDKEEDTVRRLATGWTSVLTDNPDLLICISKYLKVNSEDK